MWTQKVGHKKRLGICFLEPRQSHSTYEDKDTQQTQNVSVSIAFGSPLVVYFLGTTS